MAEDSRIAQDRRLTLQARAASKRLLLHIARVAHGPLQVGPWSGQHLCLEGSLLYIGASRLLFVRFLSAFYPDVCSPFHAFPILL